MTLSEVVNSARVGCQSCAAIRNSYAHIVGNPEALGGDKIPQISFQIPILDAGFPMGIGISDGDGWFAWNELYTACSAKSSPWPLVGRAPERKSTAFEAIEVLKEWITKCISLHPKCAAFEKALPTRVLDVSDNKISLYISQHELQPYVSLSHCWGTSPIIQTYRFNIQSRVHSISWDDLSKTFQDAIIVTRELGLRYLWIDSLCIVQDDPMDWARESGNMASIYEGAHIVLAASDARDGYDGFLTPRSVAPPPKSIYQGSNVDGETYIVRAREGDHHRWYGDLLPRRSQIPSDSSPLSTRGWAFQERLLATRYVQFRAQELIWECKSSLWCECGTLSRPSQERGNLTKKALNDSLQSSDKVAAFALWSRIVTTYASKSLTNGADTLPALSGLAKQFLKVGVGPYLAGLWQDDLPLCLLWEARGDRAFPYRAPTWSWASIDTSADGSSLITESTWDSKSSCPTTVLATVHAVSCTADTADPTGRVTNGSLTISGRTIDIKAKERNNDGDQYASPYDWDARLARPPRPHASKWVPRGLIYNPTFGFHADIALSHPKDLACILIGEVPAYKAPRALVLRKVPGVGSDTLYERVGLMDRIILGSSVRSTNWMFLFDNAPVGTFTIV